MFVEFGACLAIHMCSLFPSISGRLPLYDKIAKRIMSFIRNCLTSDSRLVNPVARYAVWYGRMTSPLGRNTFHCCRRYGLAVDDVWPATPEGFLRVVESSYDIVQVCIARMILELVFICCGFLKVQ